MPMSPRSSASPALPRADHAYEAPRVETVLLSEELEREVTYAGGGAVSDTP